MVAISSGKGRTERVNKMELKITAAEPELEQHGGHGERDTRDDKEGAIDRHDDPVDGQPFQFIIIP